MRRVDRACAQRPPRVHRSHDVRSRWRAIDWQSPELPESSARGSNTRRHARPSRIHGGREDPVTAVRESTTNVRLHSEWSRPASLAARSAPRAQSSGSRGATVPHQGLLGFLFGAALTFELFDLAHDALVNPALLPSAPGPLEVVVDAARIYAAADQRSRE